MSMDVIVNTDAIRPEDNLADLAPDVLFDVLLGRNRNQRQIIDELRPERENLRQLARRMENERDEARRDLDTERDRYAEREAEAEQLRAEVVSLRDKHEQFRQTVVDTAMRYAQRHDWCSVVREALSEMGLPVTTRYRVRTTVFTRHEGGDWMAQREYVYVTVESTDANQAWRDVDALQGSDATDALETAGVTLPDGWEFDHFDASTSDVEEVDD